MKSSIHFFKAKKGYEIIFKSTVIREMQIKTTKHHLTLIRTAVIKDTQALGLWHSKLSHHNRQADEGPLSPALFVTHINRQISGEKVYI